MELEQESGEWDHNYLKLLSGRWRQVESHSSSMVTHLYWSAHSDKNSELYVNYAGRESSNPGNYAGDRQGRR